MPNRFWVGSSGNWNDTSHWSTTSGGSGGASVPGASDVAIVDDNSSSIGSLSVVLTSSSITVNSLRIEAASFATTIDKASGVSVVTFTVQANLYLRRTIALNTTVIFSMTGNGNLQTVQPSSFPYILINSSGLVDLVGDLAVGTFSLLKGTFRTNGNAVTATSFGLSGLSSDTRLLDISGSTITARTWNAANIANNLLYAGGSRIVVGVGGFTGGGLTYATVVMDTPSQANIIGSATINTLELSAGQRNVFTAGSTTTVTNLIANGVSPTSLTYILSATPGSRFNLSKASGTVNATYVSLQDSNATGGATWNAISSVNSGNNLGWNFTGPTNVIVTPDGVATSESVSSISLVPGASTITLSSVASDAVVNDFLAEMKLTSIGALNSDESVSTLAVMQSPPPPPPPTDWEAIGKEDDKTYVYRVYKSDGTFIGIWDAEVIDKPEFTQAINTPGTTMTVALARSPNTTREVRADLGTESGLDVLTAEDGAVLVTTYETNNSVGPDTDVDMNLNVDVYVHYGEFSNLTTQNDDWLLTESGDELMVATGSPNGARIFSGYILDYELRYGEQTGVVVTLASNGAELADSLIRLGENVVVTYPNQEIATTLKDVLDNSSGRMTYDASSIVNTGVSAAMTFRLNTKKDAIESVYEQTPAGFYWFGNVATNLVNLKQANSIPDHTFVVGHHVKSLSLKKSMEQLRNLVYFLGEENATTGISILKKYQDTASQAAYRTGLHIITDRRYSVAANMQRRAEKEMSQYKEPVYTTEVSISSARYDIETIQLGQVVEFTNTSGDLQTVMLQIVSRKYTPTEVTLKLGALLENQNEIIDGVQSGLQNEQSKSIPNAPS